MISLYRLSWLLLLLPFLSGCYLTQAGAIKELSAERTMRYSAYMTAKQQAVAEVMTALKDVDRGGMKLKLDADGRVEEISYTESLDVAAITAMAKTIIPYKESDVKGVLSEMGDFVMKATNLAVPFASIYYGSKNHQSTQDANIAIAASNNSADTAMWGSFTGNYQNNITDTSAVTTTTTDTSVSSDTSVNTTSITETERVNETVTTDSSNNTTDSGDITIQ